MYSEPYDNQETVDIFQCLQATLLKKSVCAIWRNQRFS